MPDDREVIRELLAGGPGSWDRFVQGHRLVVFKAVHAAAYRFRATAADVEDAAGQVFLELLEDDAKLLRSFQGKSALTTWLSVIAYRTAAREFSRRARAREVESARPAARPRARDTDVLEQMEKLPEADRRALILFHIEDASYREIADQLGIPANQVGMVLLRAREKLAKFLNSSN
jgi:RNA polymerase sigma-70 factor (ECF subfamily)